MQILTNWNITRIESNVNPTDWDAWYVSWCEWFNRSVASSDSSRTNVWDENSSVRLKSCECTVDEWEWGEEIVEEEVVEEEVV